MNEVLSKEPSTKRILGYKFVLLLFQGSLIITKIILTHCILVDIGHLLNWPLFSRMIGNLQSDTGTESDNEIGKKIRIENYSEISGKLGHLCSWKCKSREDCK